MNIMNQQESQKSQIRFQLHYFLQDSNVHSMDAPTHNESEKYLLNSIKLLQNYIDNQINIEVLAKEEGGLQDIYDLIINIQDIPIVTFLLIAWINNYFRPQIHRTEEDKNKIEVVKDKIDIINDLKSGKFNEDEIDYLLKGNKDLEKLKSNFFAKIDNSNEVTKIETQTIFSDDKIIKTKIDKLDFSKNIIEDLIETSKKDVPDATVYIVAPVLLQGNKTYWKGIYLQEPIDFKMNDKDFLEQVYNHEIKFGAGTYIKCKLTIETKVNSTTHEGYNKYSANDIKEWMDDEHFKFETKSYIRIKDQKNQLSLDLE